MPGFTLIELSIVMIIVGIITAAVFKSQDLLESARIRTTWDQINHLKVSILTYRDEYGQWPGNDSGAARFGRDVQPGSGSGLIQPDEEKGVWAHLSKAGLGGFENGPPSPKIGGHLYVKSHELEGGLTNCIVLARTPQMEAALTPAQALSLKRKVSETNPSTGSIQFTEGQGAEPGSCVRNGSFNLKTTAPVCIALIPF